MEQWRLTVFENGKKTYQDWRDETSIRNWLSDPAGYDFIVLFESPTLIVLWDSSTSKDKLGSLWIAARW